MMSSPSVEIRSLMDSDLEQVVRIHCAAFPGSAITRLGAGAVDRYYRWLLLGPHQALCIGAFLDATLAGYCFGGIFRGATSGFLHKYRYYLMRQVILHPGLAFTPFFRRRLQEGVHGLLHARHYTEATIEERRRKKNSFTLLSIATDPNLQRMGVGNSLMKYAETYAVEQGYQQMGLTVHTDNLPALAFYENLGWQVKQELGEDTIMIRILDRKEKGSKIAGGANH